MAKRKSKKQKPSQQGLSVNTRRALNKKIDAANRRIARVDYAYMKRCWRIEQLLYVLMGDNGMRRPMWLKKLAAPKKTR